MVIRTHDSHRKGGPYDHLLDQNKKDGEMHGSPTHHLPIFPPLGHKPDTKEEEAEEPPKEEP